MIGDCPLAMRQNITKQLLRVRGSVWDSDSITAGTAIRGNSEKPAFNAPHRCYLDKAVTVLFRNSSLQRYKGNVGCCLLLNTRIWDLQWQGVWRFIGFNAEYLKCKGVCHDSQTDPLDAPLPTWNIKQYMLSWHNVCVNSQMPHASKNKRHKPNFFTHVVTSH